MHRLFVGYLGDCFIEANPGEIINEAGFSSLLWDGCEEGYPESGEVADRPGEERGRYRLPVLVMPDRF